MTNPTWYKGMPSPNPNGQPRKALGIRKLFGAEGDKIMPDGSTQRELIVKRVYEAALTLPITNQVFIKAVEIILNREYGKPLESINITDERDIESLPTSEELRILLKLREEQEKDENTQGDSAGDRAA